MRTDYDAIVIGSGITGGWAAKELTEAGLQTLVLEAGPEIIPERDYTEHIPVWDMKYRGMSDRKKLAERQAIQRECYACDELGSAFFVDDVESHVLRNQPCGVVSKEKHFSGLRIYFWVSSHRAAEFSIKVMGADGFE